MKDKLNIIIIVGSSPALSKAIQELLFTKGYDWTSGREVKYLDKEALHLDQYGGISHSDEFYAREKSKNRGIPMYQAATEFGKLVELLEAPPEIRIKLANYEAVVKSDKSGVQIGCQFAPKDTVRKVRDALVGHKGQPETIRVTGVEDKTLRKLVLSLFGGGYDDGDVTWHDAFASLLFQNGKYWTQDYNNSEYGKGAPSFDARTEMGKLVELLEGKKEQKIKINLRGQDGMLHDYDAKITETGATIQTETITKAQVEEIWAALQ